MRSLSERLYLRSPVAAQNLLVTLKGWQLERQRRSGVYTPTRADLAARRAWTPEEFAALQLADLQRALSLASRHVPYYRRRFTDHGVTPDALATVDDLRDFPLLPKADLRADPTAFVDERVPSRDRFWLHTTGTTGTPLRIAADRAARQRNYAFFDDYLESIGVTAGMPRATIGGRLVCDARRDRPPFWRHSRFQNALFFSSYHLTERNLPHYVAALRRFQPQFIDAYASSIYIIARFMCDHGLEGITPRAIMTSSEALFPEQRAVIEQAFGCPVFDQYGAAEMCVFAGECPRGRMHLRGDYGHVEILRADGSPTSVGEQGELVCTGFINPVMPLIRYRIGDAAAWAPGECECGLRTPLLERLLGREEDHVRTADGRRIGRLSPVLKGFPIREAQYEQTTIDEVVVRIVPAPGFAPHHLDQAEEEVRKRLGPSIRIRLEEVDAIPRGPGGKFKAVISRLT